MKHIKLFEQYDDPFGEETSMSYNKTFLSWVEKENLFYEGEKFLDKYIESPSDFIILNCAYASLTSLKGIEKLINLRKLYCYNNQLSNIDEITKLPYLEELWCYNNSFTEEYKNQIRNYCREKNISLSI